MLAKCAWHREDVPIVSLMSEYVKNAPPEKWTDGANKGVKILFNDTVHNI